MYNTVWLTLAAGVVMFILGLGFLVSNYGYAIKQGKSVVKQLSLSILMLLTSGGWFATAFFLYRAIQLQLVG